MSGKLKYFFICLLLSCGHLDQYEIRHPVSEVQNILNKIVILQEQNDEYNWIGVCGGTWVDADHILTAYHCTQHHPEKDSNPQEVFHFMVWGDDTIYQAYIDKQDKLHDLVLLRAANAVEHLVARVGDSLPGMGEPIQIIASVGGYQWSYRRGWVAGYRDEQFLKTLHARDNNQGPWMQMDMNINYGDSGGGVFDRDGQLCGVVDFISEDVSGGGFAMDGRVIADFLK